jgi:hypothetical protein
MEAPPHLLERSPGGQIVVAVVVPAIFGIITGLLLGFNEVAYLVLSILGIAGGIGAGYEHPNGDEGLQRGFCGGILFGTLIIVTSAVTGAEPKAHLPEPPAFLIVVTTVLGMAFGALGGWLRKRHDAKERIEAREAARA